MQPNISKPSLENPPQFQPVMSYQRRILELLQTPEDQEDPNTLSLLRSLLNEGERLKDQHCIYWDFRRKVLIKDEVIQKVFQEKFLSDEAFLSSYNAFFESIENPTVRESLRQRLWKEHFENLAVMSLGYNDKRGKDGRDLLPDLPKNQAQFSKLGTTGDLGIFSHLSYQSQLRVVSSPMFEDDAIKDLTEITKGSDLTYLHGVKELNLKWYSSEIVPLQILKIFLQNLPSLLSMDLTRTKIFTLPTDLLIEILQCIRHVKSVIISQDNVSGFLDRKFIEDEKLSVFFEQLPHLENLTMNYMTSHLFSPDELIRFFSHFSHLKSINLDNTNIENMSSEQLHAVFSNLSHVEHLSLKYNDLFSFVYGETKGLPIIFPYLKNLKKLLVSEHQDTVLILQDLIKDTQCTIINEM